MSEKLDEELVREIQDGDILSFEVLVRRYQNRIRHFVNRIVFDQEMAAEVTQDAFLKTYQAIERVDPKRKFSTFLFEVAKNTAISYLRKTKRAVPLTQDLPTEEGKTFWEKMEKNETQEKVRTALKMLPEKYQKIVGLYYFKDLSYKEIGKKLRLPVNTVRTHLRRAKLQLKELLKDD